MAVSQQKDNTYFVMSHFRSRRIHQSLQIAAAAATRLAPPVLAFPTRESEVVAPRKSPIHGQGLFATAEISPGTRII